MQLLDAINLLITVYAALVGLLVASFLNVAVYRLPHGETIVRGHSHCMSCGHALGAADLVPVLSYLMLGRRCRYCRAPISSRYMTVELAGGLFCGLAAWTGRPYGGADPLVALLLLCALAGTLLVESLIRFDGEGPVPDGLNATVLVLMTLPPLWSLAMGSLSLTGLALRLAAGGLGLALVPVLNRISRTNAALPPELGLAAKSAGADAALKPDATLPPVQSLPATGLLLGLQGLAIVVVPVLACLVPALLAPSSRIRAAGRRFAPLAGLAAFAVAALVLAR